MEGLPLLGQVGEGVEHRGEQRGFMGEGLGGDARVNASAIGGGGLILRVGAERGEQADECAHAASLHQVPRGALPYRDVADGARRLVLQGERHRTAARVAPRGQHAGVDREAPRRRLVVLRQRRVLQRTHRRRARRDCDEVVAHEAHEERQQLLVDRRRRHAAAQRRRRRGHLAATLSVEAVAAAVAPCRMCGISPRVAQRVASWLARR
mmetsp:Transcript_61530/g.162915  ORF Transcript_61530/g.162915 Transcript_61530/m.162915 type:complete len:209 (+) Transcript_61530:545-1171(+)